MQAGTKALVLGWVALTVWGCGGTGDESPSSTSAPESVARPAEGRVAPGSGPGSHLVPFPATGDLWVLDGETTNVLRIDPGGNVSIGIASEEIAAVTGVAIVDFNDCGMAFDASGTLYFSEAESDSVIRRDPSGKLSMLVSSEAIRSLTGDDTADPEGLAVGSDGRVYFLEDDTGSILIADPVTGELSYFVEDDEIIALTGIADIELGSNILAGPDGVIYMITRGRPAGFLAVGPGPTVKVLASSAALGPIDGFMTRDLSGDLIIVDDLRDMIRRLTPEGDLTSFLTQVQLEEMFGSEIKFKGGIAFDSAGNFYLLEDNSESIARFDTGLVGTVWIDEPAVHAVTGTDPDYRAGMAFEPR